MKDTSKSLDDYNNYACSSFLEDPFVCDDTGEPKGQCSHCGLKWYDHELNALPENERKSAEKIKAERSQ